MKTVFLFAAHRIFISDLLRGEYIKYLSEKYRVVVFLNDIDPAYYQSKNIIYLPFPLKMGRFWFLFDSYLRPYLIRRFDHLPGVQFRHARYGGTDPIKNTLRRIARALPKNFFNPSFFFWLERIFVPQYNLFQKQVSTYHPDLVLVATPGFSFIETWAILCAKKSGLKTAAINFSWDNLTTLPRSLRKTDYLICWNEVLKKEAVELHGYRSEEVFVSGVLRYDDFFKKEDLGTREEFLRSMRLDPKKKTILLGTSTDSDPDLYKKLIRALRSVKESNLLVSVHPLERLRDYEYFEEPGHVHIERVGTVVQGDDKNGWQTEMTEKDRAHFKKFFLFCDLIINRSSTITLDALLFDMPAINLDFGTSKVPIVTFPHYKPLIEGGAVRLAHTEEEVIRYARRYLADSSIDRENRKKIIDTMVYFRDGLSYKRSVDFLASLI